MRPVYDEGGVTLYHGDCREVLPTLTRGSVDLVLTDPPYGIGYVTARRSHDDPMVAPLHGDDHVPVDWLAEIPRLSRFRTALYWFIREDGIEAVRQAVQGIKFGLNTMLVWDKQASAVGNLNDYARRTEYIVFATNGPVRLNGSRDPNLLSVPRVNPRVMVHPTEKPLPLLSYLVMRSTDQDEMVLDPFAGSGSTLVAARQLGRRAIGIELEAKYIEVAIRRLQQAAMPLEVTA